MVTKVKPVYYTLFSVSKQTVFIGVFFGVGLFILFIKTFYYLFKHKQ